MNSVFVSFKDMARKSVERDRAVEHYVESASRLLWPWREQWLLGLCGLLALLDFTSTYACLQLSGNPHLAEGGKLAGWALREGGFPRLFWTDVAAASGLILLAVTSRFLYSRFGFRGFGRGAFALALVPYVIIAMAAIFNNIALAFL